MELIAQVIGFQLFGSALFAVNFFLLGATVGALLNVLSAIRAIVFLNKEKLRADHPLWLAGFTATFLASYVLTFTLFGKEATPIIIHAGLECGLIRAKVPDMDMISIGPETVGLHSPSERMNIASAERFWQILEKMLG